MVQVCTLLTLSVLCPFPAMSDRYAAGDDVAYCRYDKASGTEIAYPDPSDEAYTGSDDPSCPRNVGYSNAYITSEFA